MVRNKASILIQAYLVFSGLIFGVHVVHTTVNQAQEAFHEHIVEPDGVDTITMTEIVQNTEIDSTQFYFSLGSGDSMKPKIDECDLLLYQDKPFEQLEEGDIIAYEQPANGQVIVHKYLGDGEAKGINNKYADSTEVTQENYRKTVRSVVDTSGFCSGSL